MASHNLEPHHLASLSLQDRNSSSSSPTTHSASPANAGPNGSGAIYSTGDYGSLRAGSGSQAPGYHSRGPSANEGGAPAADGSGDNANASAAARFERFFATQNDAGFPPSSLATGLPGQTSGPYLAGAFGGPGAGAAPFGNTGSPNGMGLGSSSGSEAARRAMMRGAIPQQWADMTASPGGPGITASPAGSGFYNPASYQVSPGGAAGGLLDDEVIPTAIVIKNIPFSVKREVLLGLMEELTIPLPYAFNYHFDQGMFRGLAFANFRSAEEADAVVAALNGFDVQGRKLKVEYKKVLQAGEKERIEKEKAIKRMQSLQLDRERERRRMEEAAVAAMPLHHQAGSMRGAPPQLQQAFAASQAPPVPLIPTNAADAYALASQGQPGVAQRSPSGDAGTGASSLSSPAGGLRVPLTAETLRTLPSADENKPRSAPSDVSGAAGAGGGTGASTSGRRAAAAAAEELDLNDAATLEIYSRVLLFKDDRMRDELSFSKSLSPMERRTVHLVAQKLGLYHYSIGEGEERCVVVSKNEMKDNTGKTLRSQASTIGRSHRGDPLAGASGGGLGGGNALVTSNGFLSPGSSATVGRAGLRMKKSAPDMKRINEFNYGGSGAGGIPAFAGAAFGDSNAAAAAAAAGAATAAASGGARDFTFGSGSAFGAGRNAHGSLGGFKSNGNLREGYSSTVGRRTLASAGAGAAGLQSLFASPYEVPPVPQLGGPLAVTTSLDNGAGNGFANGNASDNANGGGSGFLHHQSSPSGGNSANLLRQPRGPPTPGATEQRNFAVRSRVSVASPTSAVGHGRDVSQTNGDATGSAQQYGVTMGQEGQGAGYGYGYGQESDGLDAQSHTPLEI